MRFFTNCFVVCAFAALLCLSCGTSPEAEPEKAGNDFDKAVEACAREIEDALDPGASIAVVGFEAYSPDVSNDVMEEFMGHLVRSGKLTVAERSKLELLYTELNLSMSGHISDETAVHIGKMAGAQYVITGSVTDRGGAYRLRVTAIHTETAVRKAFASADFAK
jgi:curli biogenesis system outer membrane secretion channel CsgG